MGSQLFGEIVHQVHQVVVCSFLDAGLVELETDLPADGSEFLLLKRGDPVFEIQLVVFLF